MPTKRSKKSMDIKCLLSAKSLDEVEKAFLAVPGSKPSVERRSKYK